MTFLLYPNNSIVCFLMSLPTLFVPGSIHEHPDTIPIEFIKNYVKESLNKTGIEHRVLVLRAETASGKSTTIPPAMFKLAGSKSVICTQPRVITAIENVREIAKWNKDLVIGRNMGWLTKYNKLRPMASGMISATIGTLYMQLTTWSDQQIMAKYRIIMIDETHERDINVDMTIYLLKQFLDRCANLIDCPYVIFMSATFDPEPFLKYFGLPKQNFIRVIGATSPVEEIWDWNGGRMTNDWMTSTCELVKLISESDSTSRSDILIFAPGKKEFGILDKMLRPLQESLANTFSLLMIDGNAVRYNARDYLMLMRPIQEITLGKKRIQPLRRLIVSTNVAETGLTLPDLKYVIDCGYNREVTYVPTFNVGGLITAPAPKSRIRQRRGRVGRGRPGVFYPLYPKYIYDKLPDDQLPQIATDDLSAVYLNIIRISMKKNPDISLAEDPDAVFSVGKLSMITNPNLEQSANVLERLYKLGFITIDPSSDKRTPMYSNVRLTRDGEFVSQLPIRPEYSRAILSSFSHGAATTDLIAIVCWLQLQVRVDKVDWGAVYKMGFPHVARDASRLSECRLIIGDEFIDGLILWYAIMQIIKKEKNNPITALKVWSEKVGLKYADILEFITLREELMQTLLEFRVHVYRNETSSLWNAEIPAIVDTVFRLKYSIYDGFRCNLLTRACKDITNFKSCEYTTDQGLKVAVKLDVALGVAPTYLLYSSLNLREMPGLCTISASHISILDGYLGPDIMFAW